MGVALIAVATMAFCDAVDRLEPTKLRALHEAIAALERQRRPATNPGEWTDYRAAIHVHSKWSHDSRGTIEQIVEAATKSNVRVLMFTEHPARTYDYFRDGHRGARDGILLIPGAETGGFLAFPRRSIQEEKTSSPQEFALLVRKADGLVFLSHLEERMDWTIDGLTGTEIYNTHADVKEEKRLLPMLRSPAGLLKLAAGFRQYPQEAFGALLDYPADYLRRYDELCRHSRHTGISANDAHQNQGVAIRLAEGKKVQIVDALGELQRELPLDSQPLLKPLAFGKKPGDALFELLLDPYHCSFRHVSTHLLMKSLDEEAVWDALKQGRAYVAFDWLGDPTGLRVIAIDAAGRVRELGEEFRWGKGTRIEARSPLPCCIRLMRDGSKVAESIGVDVSFAVEQPGVYRIEAWLELAGERKPWVLANPFYVRPSD